MIFVQKRIPTYLAQTVHLQRYRSWLIQHYNVLKTYLQSLDLLIVLCCYNEDYLRYLHVIGQIWDFAKEIKKGDIIALPRKSQSSIVLGRVNGDYEFKEISPIIKHIRAVKWIRTVPRSEFDQDLLFSLGAFSTVCKLAGITQKSA